MSREVNIKEWIEGVINGPGGLLSMEEHEFAVRTKSAEYTAVDWVIRCLANPECEGSGDILSSIQEQRFKSLKLKKDKVCGHHNFRVNADVFRLFDTKDENMADPPIKAYTMDLRVSCAECNLPFEFIGIPYGIAPHEPRIGVDGLEMRAPIVPSDKKTVNKNAN